MSTSVRLLFKSLAHNLTSINLYVGADTSVSGSRFGAGASPSLAHLVRGAAQDVPHPTREGASLWDARADKGALTGPADADVVAMAAAEEQTVYPNFGISPLGSGSDYTIFLQRIGVRRVLESQPPMSQ